jgi:hypothetical protein
MNDQVNTELVQANQTQEGQVQKVETFTSTSPTPVQEEVTEPVVI